MNKLNFSTLCIHAGEEYKPDIIPPIHMSTTYLWYGEEQEYVYSRVDNQTRKALESKMTILECGKASLAFSSGMAAIATVILSLVKPGDEIIVSDDLYSGTEGLMHKLRDEYKLHVKFIDTTNPENIEREISNRTKIIFIETPSNPLLKISDIKAISEVASRYNVKLIVDSTFASPYIQKPIKLGADIVVHSATKYLGGHNDILAGIATFNSLEDYECVKYMRSRLGTPLPPFDSYLLLRSIKTLALRMERHCRNAFELSRYLLEHPKIKQVIYPFLESHPQYDIARKQMKCGGGMISFRLRSNDPKDAKRFLTRLRIIKSAVSLGSVVSLIECPYIMTHSRLPEEERLKRGITPDLIRFSVGIEDVNDLINDLEQALKEL